MRYRIIYFNALNSTNTCALSLARDGSSEGTVIVADFQTKGRGRFKRRWVSPRGKNLLFSLIIHPSCLVNAVPLLTHISARTVKEVLEASATVSCTLKKPNDVLINGRKVCGILTESHSRSRAVDYVVIGIGVNVNSTRVQLIKGATSLREETNQLCDRDVLLKNILKKFSSHYKTFLNQHS